EAYLSFFTLTSYSDTCTLSLHDALPILFWCSRTLPGFKSIAFIFGISGRSRLVSVRRWGFPALHTSRRTAGKSGMGHRSQTGGGSEPAVVAARVPGAAPRQSRRAWPDPR